MGISFGGGVVAKAEPHTAGIESDRNIGYSYWISHRHCSVDADWTSQLARSIVAYIPNLLGAALVLLVGTVVARFLARSVLIGAVNLNLHYARLLSLGVKWMVVVLTVAMALEHLRIAPGIVKLAFGILFGGIVVTLALAVGLGSKDLVTKSLERDAQKASGDNIEEPFRHL